MKRIATIVAGAAALAALAVPAVAQRKVSFQTQILPILKNSCFQCHQETYKDAKGRTRRPKSGLRLDGKGWILKGGKNGVAVIPGRASESPLYTLTTLPPDDDDIMPAKGKALSKRQTDAIKRWIDEGCNFGSWSGKRGPDAALVAAAQEAAKPKRLSTSGMQAITKLGRGLKPALPQAVQRAAGRKCQVVPVVPGSPLLRVAFVSNEATVRDADLAKLAPLAGHITHLGLGKTRITDAALEPVSKMQRLTRLDLNRTPITDAGLAKLANLTELRYLNLHSTSVTDEGVLALAKLRKLEAVYLWNSQVTTAGVHALQAKLPKTKISYKLAIPNVGNRPRPGARSRRRGKKK